MECDHFNLFSDSNNCMNHNFREINMQFYTHIIPFSFLDESNCTVKIDGKTINKAIGEIWSSSKDLCLKHTCEIGPNGTAIESTFSEYCSHHCNNVRIRC